MIIFSLVGKRFLTNAVQGREDGTSSPHDIVKMYTDAFRAAGLKVGLYFSIWDRTYPVQATDTR